MLTWRENWLGRSWRDPDVPPRRRFLYLLLFVISRAWKLAAQELRLPVKPDSLKFAAFGDMGTGDHEQYELAKQMIASHEKFPYDMVIMLGDNMYGGQKPQDFVKKFETPYRPLLDGGVTFYASLGNHDEPTNINYKFFNMGGQRFYSFVKQNVRFFSLDSNSVDGKELAWLEPALRDAKEDWKICFFHHPLYSSAGTHGSQVDVRVLFEPLFVKYGVNVVFAGHDHVYERIKPQKGIYHFVSGAGGQLRKGDLKRTDLTAAGFDRDQSFMMIEVAGDEMAFQVISRTGTTVDFGTITRQNRAATAATLMEAVP